MDSAKIVDERRQKRMSYLPLVKKIEDKYGSIAKCPENDQNLEKLHEIFREANYHLISKEERIEQVCDLIYEGKTVKRISNILKISGARVRSILAKQNLTPIPVFKYKLVKNYKVVYTTSLIRYCETIGIYNKVNYQLYYMLPQKGYKLTRGKFAWSKIKDGEYYYTSNFKKAIVKHGRKSFVFED